MPHSNPDPNNPARTSSSGYSLTPLTRDEINTRAASLTPMERRIILSQGTERSFCGTLLDNKREGSYCCRLCELPLFSSTAKFDSGTGWPSFYEPFDPEHIRSIDDRSHGMIRTEIRCERCGAHLGHVFDDGPPPTGLRYCLNSASLHFVESGNTPSSR